MTPLPFCLLGCVNYERARQLQLRLIEEIYCQNLPGILLLLEHPHVFTLGKAATRKHILVSDEVLRREGIEVYSVERGGDITYHGPGQIVGYPLVNLSLWNKDVHLYLRSLEEVIIQFLRRFEMFAFRLPPHTGVWMNKNQPEKIAAIGVAVKKWVTYHGFAFNIATDLKYFSYIIPCGIRDKGVTSLEKVYGKRFSLIEREEFNRSLVEDFSRVFGFQMVEMDSQPLKKWIAGDVNTVTSDQ